MTLGFGASFPQICHPCSRTRAALMPNNKPASSAIVVPPCPVSVLVLFEIRPDIGREDSKACASSLTGAKRHKSPMTLTFRTAPVNAASLRKNLPCWPCPACSSVYGREDTVVQHIRNRTDEQHRTYASALNETKCRRCKQNFRTTTGCRRHFRTCTPGEFVNTGVERDVAIVDARALDVK